MLDQLRELRFLVPPFFFLASVAWGAYVDLGSKFVEAMVKFKDVQTIVIAGVGAATIPFGFLIGVISIFFLRLFLRRPVRQRWDVAHSESTVDAMWSALGLRRERRLDMQAVSTFDRTLNKEILDWLVRRWTSFLVSVNSITALVLAQGCLLWERIRFGAHSAWGGSHLAVAVLICALLLYNARVAWDDTKGMGELQARIASSKRAPTFE